MRLTVTVCQLPDDPSAFDSAWAALQDHTWSKSTDLLLLSEAPFAPWFARRPAYHAPTWEAAVERHRQALDELRHEGALVATMPLEHAGRRRQRSFSWTPADGLDHWRHKAYLPDEEDVYEASWYEPVPDPPDVRMIAGARVGILICTELWKFEWAAAMGRMGAQLIVTPRATGADSVDKWLTGGRAAAISAGAYSLSSNRTGGPFGGHGWVISPDGDLLAETDADAPFRTVTLDLDLADRAKATYPRYALWRD